MSTSRVPVVILTALDVEYEAVRDQLKELRTHRHAAGTRFEIGRIGSSDCSAVLGLVGKGNHPAAVLAERAIAEFSPGALLFVGIAGGLWPNIGLGDIVVANKIYAYHGGTSEDDGLKARPKAWEISHEADQIAHHVARSTGWRSGLPGHSAPVVHFGPVAAGEVVQYSAISEQVRWIREHYNDAVAIEMEAAGVAQAGHLNGALPAVVVRGISDHADGTKVATDRRGWQPRAARHAAAFAVALARELIVDGLDARKQSTISDGSHLMSVESQNIATGNARVGAQIGQVFGSVVVGGAEQLVELRASLSDLHARLRQARDSGQLDEGTCTAAEQELGIAEECAAKGSSRENGGLLIALKRLRGLVGDVADLAVRVTAIIAAARGLS